MKIDSAKCIGCGICQTMCPQCFKIAGGVCQVQKDSCAECNLQEIAESCPVEAIILEK